MQLFDVWCEIDKKEESQGKHFWSLKEKTNGREAIKRLLTERIRSHYDQPEKISEDVARLGYKAAAEILKVRLPQTQKARSGELGEILAVELVEEKTAFRVPIRRLRYKDSREMALRGDDFIGVVYDEERKLSLLKGKSKSKENLDKTTIIKGREALGKNDGRCTPASLIFISDRLLESKNEEDVELGRIIRDEVGLNALRSNCIDHMLFTVSRNDSSAALRDDLNTATADRAHYAVHLQIVDHQDFIAITYEEAQKLGDS